MSVAAKLKELRLNKGRSLQDVADAVGASKAHIWDLETGRATNPTLELLLKLSRYYSVSISEIVGENPNAEGEQSELMALFRDLKALSDTDRETIQIMMERLRKRPPET